MPWPQRSIKEAIAQRDSSFQVLFLVFFTCRLHNSNRQYKVTIDGKAVSVEIRKQMKQAENRKYIIFAGTSEGRLLYEFCEQHQIGAVFCVATEYGKEILCKSREAKNENSEEQNIKNENSEEQNVKNKNTEEHNVKNKNTEEQNVRNKNTEAQDVKNKNTEEQNVKNESAEEQKEQTESVSTYPVIHVGRMNTEEMENFFRKEGPDMIIDATHPYAVEVTENIKKAAEVYCRERQEAGQVYYRVLRNLTEDGMAEEDMLYAGDAKISYHEDMQQAVTHLQSTEGNVLATTGSKQAEELCKLNNFAKRVYLRILPSEEMKAKCLALGFLPEHIICMQGPFSRESNEQILREHDIKYLLTKQSGKTGGYPEKAEAARNCGVELVVLAPPQEKDGVSVEQMCEIMKESE